MSDHKAIEQHRDLEGLSEFITGYFGETADSRMVAVAEAAWYRCMERRAAPTSEPAAVDRGGFDGDNAALCRAIDALLSLDAAGALVPHGLGGHARNLLNTASIRLNTPAAQEVPAAPNCKLCNDTGDMSLGPTDYFGECSCAAAPEVPAPAPVAGKPISKSTAAEGNWKGDPAPQGAQAQPVNGISATMRHDEGAIARCSYCKRYSLDPATLSDRAPACECGKKHGWSGSFVKPTPESKFLSVAPTNSWLF